MSMTLRFGDNTVETAGDGQPPEAETRMRRALGLLPGGAARPRNRSAEGPVIVEHRGERHPERNTQAATNRVAAAEAALATERAAREQLARQLRDVEAALREAQTKRGHAELARNEAIEALAAERAAREAAEAQLRDFSAPQRPAPRTAAAPSAELADALAPKRRGRPPGSKSKPKVAPVAMREAHQDDEAEGAVEWWVPGWQDRLTRN